MHFGAAESLSSGLLRRTPKHGYGLLKSQFAIPTAVPGLTSGYHRFVPLCRRFYGFALCFSCGKFGRFAFLHYLCIR